MKLRPNPFRPDKPVTDFDLFAGRAEELKVLVDALFQVGYGNPRYMIVTGPRGIGKSSFINQIDSLANDSLRILNELEIAEPEFGFRFAIFKHIAVKNQTTEDIVISLIRQMRTETKSDLGSKIDALLEKWRPTFKIPAIGEIQYQPLSSQLNSELCADFVDTVGSLWKDINQNTDGIVIIIDEVDTVAKETSISSFLKTTTEVLLNSNLQNVVFCLGGITDAMDKLREDHPSIERVFERIELNPLKTNESEDVISKALLSTDESSLVTIADIAMKQIVSLAGGFPAVIHQFCYHAYRHDTDGTIDADDLNKAFKDVVTRIKRQELDESLRDAGRGYARQILFVMARSDKLEVRLADIAKKLNKTTNEISSPITKLVRNGKVDRIERGWYIIKDPLLRLYIRQLDDEYDQQQTVSDRQLSLGLNASVK